MSKIGLVFSGGGSCGAYQIGFWKALREYGAEQNVIALSGSSVGSLNALLFANGDLRLAESIWKKLKWTDLYRLRSFWDAKGLFSQIGYARLIDRIASDWERLRRGIPIYSCVSVLDDERHIDLKRREAGRPEYILLNELDHRKMKNTVLASTAMPYIYPHRHVRGKLCIDGDFSDKTPYLPLTDLGCDCIIVLHLNSVEEASHRRLESDEDRVPGTEIKLCHLYPEKSLGNFLAVSKALTLERMKKGYREGMQFCVKELSPSTHEKCVKENRPL